MISVVLTPRQSELVRFLAADHSLKEAAYLMDPPITEGTARTYVSSARRRLGIKTTYGLVRYIVLEDANVVKVCACGP